MTPIRHLALAGLLVLTSAARTQDTDTTPPPSCAEVARQILDPLLDAYQTALLAAAIYDELNNEQIFAIQQRIDELENVRANGSEDEVEAAAKKLASEQTNLSAARSRSTRRTLSPIPRRRFDGPEIDAHVAATRKSLDDAEAQIAAGTRRVWVETLDKRTDRNHVQALIRSVEKQIVDMKANWAAGKYRDHNSILRHSTSNGAIETEIARLEKGLADYRALGLQARARVGNWKTTGQTVKNALDDAKRGGDPATIRRAQEKFDEWKASHAAEIKGWEDSIRKQKDVLEAHREAFDSEIAAAGDSIANRLNRALAETPCGGGGGYDQVERLRDFLRRHSEDENEAMCRIARFDDEVYVQPNGAVIGSIRDALVAALRDLPLGPTAMSLDVGDLGESRDLMADRALQRWDAAARAIQAGSDPAGLGSQGVALASVLEAQRRLGLFYDRVRAMPQRSRDLAELGPALAADFQDLPELLGAAYTNRALIDQAIRDLGRGAVGPEARALRDQLIAVRDALDDPQLGRAVGRLGETLSTLRGFAGRQTSATLWANAQGARAVVNSNIQSILDATGEELQNSRLARIMLVASLYKGMADTHTRVQGGMPYAEAFARSTADFVVDLAIAGVPLTAAAEMIASLGLNAATALTGDDAYKQSTPGELAKLVTQWSLDILAERSRALGSKGSARRVAELLDNIDTNDVEARLVEVEGRLANAEPGSAEAQRLMRARRTFRRILRRKRGECLDPSVPFDPGAALHEAKRDR